MNKCEFPHPRIRSTKLVVKKNLNSCWRISPCCNYLLMWKENGRPLLYTLYFSWTQGCIAPCLFETGPMVLEMKNFECRHCNFTILPWSSSPWETVWHFILSKLDIKMVCAESGWNCPCSSAWKEYEKYKDRQLTTADQ